MDLLGILASWQSRKAVVNGISHSLIPAKIRFNTPKYRTRAMFTICALGQLNSFALKVN